MADAPDETRVLLDGWHGGDRKALDRLLERDLPWVRTQVRRRLGDELRAKMDSHDVVQEAMVDVLRYGPRFTMSDRGQFRALLARIVENNLRDNHDWARARRRAAEKEQAIPASSSLDLDPSATITQPPAAVERAEKRQWVRLALELLSPEDRRVLHLRQWEKLPFEDIGQKLGLEANTARMRFQRAVDRLARRMRKLRNGEFEGSDDE